MTHYVSIGTLDSTRLLTELQQLAVLYLKPQKVHP